MRKKINIKPFVGQMTRVTWILFMLIIGVTASTSQEIGILSGSIYMLQSKSNGKLINVSHSSLENLANVNLWTDTKSDAQRWLIKQVDDTLYTFENIGSGNYLHSAKAIPSEGTNADQYNDSNRRSVKWKISHLGGDQYKIHAAGNPMFVVGSSEGTVTDGANAFLTQLGNHDSQIWKLTLHQAREMAPSKEIADEVFESWKKKYYDTRTGNEVVKGEGFWGVAEIMEIVVDAYEVTGNGKYLSMFDEMYRTFIAREGEDWMWNAYNDDITWMVLACSRAYLLSGRQPYLAKAKDQFDKMYARALTDDFGGGLIWKEGILSKNSCINGPAMVACCYLAQATGDETYYQKAISLYNWSKLYLFNANTGKVNDAYDGQVHNWSSTYNQGTYLGASVMLYNYTKDASYLHAAQRIARFTKEEMFHSNVINSEDGPDLQGFKGIFMRYARRYVVDCNRPDYIPWLQLNAKVAYNNRNSQNIIQTIWADRTSETTSSPAFGAASPVSLLINCPLSTSLSKVAYERIESEDFDYLKGVIVESSPDGTDNIGGVQDGAYTVYKNVDFGFKGAESMEFRLSSAGQGGSIEIRLGSTTGQLIGKADIGGTGKWSTYATFSTTVQSIKGLQDIYLMYKGEGYLFNINHFKFIEASEESETRGLLGSYYNGRNFESLVVQRVDTAIFFNWEDLSPAAGINNDHYSVRWIGKIHAPSTGTYTFYINSDNGRRVWINGELIIDKWIGDWGTVYSGTIDLQGNQKYDIKVEYFEEIGGADIKLEWSYGEHQCEVIPGSHLFMPEMVGTSLPGSKYFEKEAIKLYPNPATTTLNIECGNHAIEKVSIYDLKGRIVFQGNGTNEVMSRIDVSNLAKGLYVVKLNYDSGKQAIGKFSK